MAATKQPSWKFIGNLGDASPLDGGGYFIYKDRTGVYPEEAELLVVDEESEKYTIYRFPLERLKLVDDHLVPLQYEAWWGTPGRRGVLDWTPDPSKNYSEWFEDSIPEMARFVGMPERGLKTAFTAAGPLERAEAYRVVGEYHGWENLDSYPFTDLSRAEVKKRYRSELKSMGR